MLGQRRLETSAAMVPERTPDALLADEDYDADAIRVNLTGRNVEAVIPGRSNRSVKF